MLAARTISVLNKLHSHAQPVCHLRNPQSSIVRRLLSSLALLEQRDSKLNTSSLAAVSAARKLGGSITGFIAGGGIKPAAEEASKVKGLDKVVYVDNEAYNRVSRPGD